MHTGPSAARGSTVRRGHPATRAPASYRPAALASRNSAVKSSRGEDVSDAEREPVMRPSTLHSCR